MSNFIICTIDSSMCVCRWHQFFELSNFYSFLCKKLILTYFWILKKVSKFKLYFRKKIILTYFRNSNKFLLEIRFFRNWMGFCKNLISLKDWVCHGFLLLHNVICIHNYNLFKVMKSFGNFFFSKLTILTFAINLG